MTNRGAIAALALLATVVACSREAAKPVRSEAPITREFFDPPSVAQLRSLDQYFTEMVGATAVDCGRVSPSADFFMLSPALQCVRRAQRRHEPFKFVQYGNVLDEGHSASGLVGRDGVMHQFRQSTVECPGPPCSEDYWFRTEICANPRVGWHQLTCDAQPNPLR